MTSQRLIRIYWLTLALTCVISALALVNSVAFVATILTLGAAFFVFTGASWIFLVLLALMPVMYLRTARGQGVAVASAFVLLALALGVGPITAKRAAEAMLPTDSRQTPAPTQVHLLDLSVANELGCDALCWRTLSGRDIAKIRPAPGLLYVRDATGTCRMLDPNYPDTAACLLVQPDNGAVADLTLTQTSESLGVEHANLLFQPVERRILRISGPTGVLWQRGQLFYQVSTFWPLLTLSQQGREASYRLLTWYTQTDSVSPEIALADLGIDLVAQPPPKKADLGLIEFDVPGGRPQDAILVATALSAKVPLDNLHFAADLKRYLSGLEPGGQLSGFDTALIANLAAEHRLSGFPGLGAAIAQMQKAIPTAVSFDTLFARAGEGNSDTGRQAAIALSTRLVSAPAGTFVAHAKAYRTIIDGETGSFHWTLMAPVGLFGFDPTPYLTTWMLEGREDHMVTQFALQGACRSASQWDDAVLALARDYLADERNALSAGRVTPSSTNALRTLAQHGQPAEADAIISRINPAFLKPRHREAWRRDLRVAALDSRCGPLW